MNKVWKTAVIVALADFGLLLIVFIPAGIPIAIVALLGELIFGIAYCFVTGKKELGQGILLGLGLFLLIGGVVCSIIVANLNFH